jgi:hypothetical protein
MEKTWTLFIATSLRPVSLFVAAIGCVTTITAIVTRSARVLIGVGLCLFRERRDPPFHLGHTNVNETFLAPRCEKRKTTA